ncbi:MAG: alanine--tRNA ligase [Nitrososphaerota archaeon]|nr:alanine--tRNA ligase [Nitrososphaerota archaeon]
MKFGPEAYSLEFFRERGYLRKRCRVCGEHFWTVDPERETCGDSPCEPYRFVGKALARRKMSLREVREAFLRFFEKRGHRVISPYPVVARWRSDMFLTDASIVDFQPFVTSGIAPPPANPLVISQPCIRLVDIDKVGLTFGRHLTIFEMGGAHAFNYPEKEVYWKDETVKYYHEFAQEIFGIPEGELVYKEGVWSGGGNAGPCFESISYGMELATLVFMQYKTLNGELIELPIRTVDTGYGIERFTWFSQGTPSCFDAIYGELYPKVAKIIEIPKPDEKLLLKYSPYTALVVPGKGVTVAEARRRVAEASGIPLEVIINEVEPLERIYAALDFTKSISFIISEGVVPSNVRVGYLARLLIRKTYRLLRSMGHEDKLLDLIDLQLDHWSSDFPHLREMREEVLDIVETEIKKFEETIQKGSDYVEKELSSMKKGEVRIPVEFLIRVYDERGITPDIVEPIASKLDMEIEVPENFYELVASRHLRAETGPVEDAEKKILEEVFREVPATEKAYYEQPFVSKFRAKVLKTYGNYLVLDRTHFYPEGGGAVADRGVIKNSKGSSKVVNVQMLAGGVIVHKLEGELPEVGEVVEAEIDFERRLSLMRHHTATHIILGAARKVLGRHAWQAGASKEPEIARLDISHHRRLTYEEIKQIEDEANRIVAARIPVKITLMSRNEAEARYGFQLYQGGEVPSAEIRVVEIPGWDAEACAGLHVENTEDVGIIKIIKTERIQDGVERLIFAAGPAVLPYLQEDWRLVRRIAEIIGTPVEAVERKVEEILDEVKELRREVKSLLSSAAKLRAVELSQKPTITAGGIEFYVSRENEDDREYVLKISDHLLSRPVAACFIAAYGRERVSLVATANSEALKKGVHAGKLISMIAQRLGGRGGGRDRFGEGGLGKPISEDEFIKESLNIIRELFK